MDNFRKFSEPSLPPRKGFYSSLTDEDITDEDYEHAKKVWKSFNMKTVRDYHDLYLKVDVLLLADIMERFREICMENYKLDPAWYYTSPGLAWDACLKVTRVCLDLISDPVMFNFVEKAKRELEEQLEKELEEPMEEKVLEEKKKVEKPKGPTPGMTKMDRPNPCTIS
ncbi:RNA-directed DNA polymerase from mobile element jockey [Paramuricea clavata]|uniref:RNA-directed DNA polymerase from mobile element jockey n=1 Tax=Paramuricea clavata TaxID=317549 RepID=A0A6S7L846_PARCT|nr:RNA-directed DNA polymerase from mobile element jockey [Paramuricea clavata]